MAALVQVIRRAGARMSGLLYVVSTPLGNVEDITLRALRVLKHVDVIAAEDPGQIQRLFRHYRIRTPVTSYHNLNKEEKAPVFLDRLEKGHSLALVCDAGTPLVCDPGAYLVRRALNAGIRVVPVPGPSAILAALAVSGFPGSPFVFRGFLPTAQAARRRALRAMRNDPCTSVLFESGPRLSATLLEIAAVSPRRQMVLACNLTKPDEVLLCGTARDVSRQWEASDRQHGLSEITLVVSGSAGAGKRGTGRKKRATRRGVSGS